ncbi:MAG: hypothetical protein NUW37_06805 [Planctomycetes bacterium]|nr:hypothetical protein [Planctomycetota bacterium]
MARDYNIQKGKLACCVTHREFANGEAYYSVIRPVDDENFVREDYSVEEFKKLDKDKLFSYWKSRRVIESSPGKPKFDLARTEMFLDSLLKSEIQDHSLLFVLSLVLMRKKRLKVAGSRIADGKEFMTFEVSGTKRKFDVENPNLTDEKIEEINNRITMLLTSYDPAAEESERKAPASAVAEEESTPE